MLSKRSLLAAVLALAMAAVQLSTAAAAKPSQATTITGTIQSVTTGTDAGGNTIIIVKFTDTAGQTQTANLSVSQAEALNLITVDSSGNITIIAVAGQPITLDSSVVKTDPCTLPTGASQPVGEALAGFFCGSLGVDYSMINAWHTSGFGFGVITQALFMAQALGGDSSLADQILMAKQSHDFTGLVLPDGSTPRNWGQLMKDVLSGEVKSLTNLGAIMSGRAQPQTSTTTGATTGTTTTTATGNGNAAGHGQAHGQGHGHGNGGTHGQSGAHVR